MSKQIKLTVNTGWAGCDHVDYTELPCNWDNLAEGGKEKCLEDWSMAYLHACCTSYAEVVEDADD